MRKEKILFTKRYVVVLVINHVLHVFTSPNIRHIPANQDLDRLTIQ